MLFYLLTVSFTEEFSVSDNKEWRRQDNLKKDSLRKQKEHEKCKKNVDCARKNYTFQS